MGAEETKRTAGDRPHYACRWVCQKDAAKCDGSFEAKDVRTYPCPLVGKCLADDHTDGQLEQLFKRARSGKLICPGASLHQKEHHDRLQELLDALFPEKKRARWQTYYAENKEHLSGKRLETLQDLIPGYVPLTAAKPGPTPPCGGDCESGCPYDECRYPDWEEDGGDIYIDPKGRKTNRADSRRWGKAYHERVKAKMAADPVFAEDQRAKKRKSSMKHYYKVKFVKAGGSPEEFESQWRRDNE